LRAFAGLVLLEGLFLGTVLVAAGWVVSTLGGGAIAVANVLAVVSMGLWVWRRRPSLGDGPRPQTAGAAGRRVAV
jgi:hypothetical protein